MWNENIFEDSFLKKWNFKICRTCKNYKITSSLYTV